MMRAMVLEKPGVPIESSPLVLGELQEPTPAEREVRVRVSCARSVGRICTSSRAICRPRSRRSFRGIRSSASSISSGRDARSFGSAIASASLGCDPPAGVPVLHQRTREPLPVLAIHRLPRGRRIRGVRDGARRLRVRAADGVR